MSLNQSTTGGASRRITVYVLKPRDRPYFKLEWVQPGTTIRKSMSTRTADPGKAEEMRAELEYELNHGLHAEPCRASWEDFSKRYAEEKIADRRINTQKKWATVSASFRDRARPRDLGSVNASMLSRYAATLRNDGCGKATVSGHLAYLRAALRWAKRQGLLADVPPIDMPKLPRKVQIRKTDQGGYLRLLNAAPAGDWRTFLAIAWYTGRRRGEVLALEWSAENGRPWLDLDRGRLWLPAEWNKGDADFWLPLHPDLLATLRPLRRADGPVVRLSASANEVSRKFTAIARRAGLSLTLHDLKRSFASRYASKVPAQQLQRLAGHADIRTTLAYYADLDDGLEEAIKLA